MSDTSFSLDSWLASIFASTKGEVDVLTADSGEVLTSRDPQQIEAFAAKHENIDLDLATAAPDVAGFAIVFAKDRYAEAIDKLGRPSLEVFASDDIFGIYLLKPERRREVIKLVLDTYADEAGTVIPLPTGSRTTPQPDPDPDQVRYFSAEEIEAAFLYAGEEAEQVELRETSDAPPAAPDAEPEDMQESSGSSKHNEATVIHGERLTEAMLAQPLKINIGARRDAPKWHPAHGLTVLGLVDKLTQHTVGKKDGQAFLQGFTPTGERKKSAMTELCIAGLDVDCGMPLQPVLDRIAELGLFALVYTTHSHLTTESEINEKKFMEFARKHDLQDDPPEPEGLARFMKEVLHYETAIADTVKYEHAIEGTPNLLLSHAPIPKYRLIFPLVKPFVFTEQKRDIKGQMRKMTQPEAHNRWRAKMMGLAGLLQVPIDKSCAEPARLFYLPRRPESATEWKSYVVGGALLDLDKVPEKDDRVRGAEEKDVFAKIAGEMIGNAREMEFTLAETGTNLKEWAGSFAEGFQITLMFDDLQPDLVREKMTDHKWAVACPFDDEHTNTGDENDRGTFICDGASDDAHGGGFIFKCQHAHCVGRDRLHMLKKAIEEGWFEESALTSDAYNDVLLKEDEEREPEQPAEEEDDHGQAEAEETMRDASDEARKEKEKLRQQELSKLRKKLETLDEETEVIEIEQLVEDFCYHEANDLTMAHLVSAIVNKTKKFTKTDLKGFIKRAKAKAKSRREAMGEKKTYQQRLLEFLANNKHIQRPRGKDIILMDTADYDETKALLIETVNEHNAKTPLLFRFGEGNVRCAKLPVGDWELAGMKDSIMRDAVHNFVVLYKDGQDGVQTIRLTDDFARDLCSTTELKLPKLAGFSALPFYTASGRLVSENGFDKESGIILRMPLGYKLPEVPKVPTEAQVADALDLLLGQTFFDFPFDDGWQGKPGGHGSRAHFMALLLQPIVRPLISDQTPMYLVSKPMPGTGASYLVGGAVQIAHGEKARAQSQVLNEEEIRKNITSQFNSGKRYIWIDNLTRKVDSGAMSNLVTGPVWEDRALGTNGVMSFPNFMQVIISGNNPSLSSELWRRSAPIRLDAKLNPKKRDSTKFKIQNFEQFVTENQPELFAACLTLVNHWIAKGMPTWKPEPGQRVLPTFYSWSMIMGGLLQSIGLPGFLSNMHLTDEVNEDDLAWSAFVSYWLHNKDIGFGTKAQGDPLVNMYCNMPNRPTLPHVKDQDEPSQVKHTFMKALKIMRDVAVEATDAQGLTTEFMIRMSTENHNEWFWVEKVDRK